VNTPKTEIAIVPVTGRRASMLAPLVDVVFAARNFFIRGTDDVPAAQEPIEMPVAKARKKIPRPAVEVAPADARLEAAVRKAAGAKAKAREAKTELKQAKKAFRIARKAAKTARKDVEALQAAITRAEDRAAAAAKRARSTRRAATTALPRAAGSATPRSPATAKPTRATRRPAPSTGSDPEVVYTEALATPAEPSDGSPSDASS
jgi:hypothetical protein